MIRRSARNLLQAGSSVLLVITLSAHCAPAQPPGRRSPTASERALVDRYKEIVLKFLEPFANEDWQEDPTGEYQISDDYLVTLRPEIPFEITDSIRRSYRVPGGSPYYQRVMAPLLEKMQGMKDPQAMKALFEHVERTELSISFQFNSIEATYDADPPKRREVTVPGAELAWEIPEERQKKVTLFFGDWAAAQRSSSGLVYRFKRKGKYLAIENLAVELEGNGMRIDELLRTLDWKQLNAAIYSAR